MDSQSTVGLELLRRATGGYASPETAETAPWPGRSASRGRRRPCSPPRGPTDKSRHSRGRRRARTRSRVPLNRRPGAGSASMCGAIPTLVVWTTRSAKLPRGVHPRGIQPAVRRAERLRQLLRVRRSSCSGRAPGRRRQQAQEPRRVPPACADHCRRRAGGDAPPSLARSGARNPATSVFVPCQGPAHAGPGQGVACADRLHQRVARSESAQHRLLVGDRHGESPDRPGVGNFQKPSRSGTWKGRYTASIPRRRNRGCGSRGERECMTGFPMTP